ncbi:hypothetical protein GCM10007162_14460 [Ignatzschineria ureiclastica]|nr:hypothetical protein GCM10007162_14460 [Ignatzschineria ureiclastica]
MDNPLQKCLLFAKGCDYYNERKRNAYFIKSGGGTGPVKPGNLDTKKVSKVLTPTVEPQGFTER